MPNDDYKDYLLFIAQDTLQEIRENKKDQRGITFNFMLVIAALFAVFEILKIRFNVQIPHVIIKSLMTLYGVFTIYLLIKLQIGLSQYRRRITRIWDEKSFEFAFEKEILRYKKDCKEQYYSFWHNFADFTLVYIIIVVLIALLVIFLL